MWRGTVRSALPVHQGEMEEIQYPPGIRFHPSDVELISYYLERKVKNLPLPPNVVTDVDLYSFDPWDLPRNTVCGEDDECFFFTPRNRKYPNGGRPNRAAASGYWKATATDQPIFHASSKIGVKKGLVFYQGRPPSRHRTHWIMTEYRLPDTSRPSRSTPSMRLDDWVLCRIRRKGNMSKNENVTEPPSACAQDCRDMLSDYLQSNEYNVIVSLLAGHDPAALTISPRHTNRNHQRSRAPRADGSEKQNSYLFQTFSHHSDSTQSEEQISYGDIHLPSNMTTLNDQSQPFGTTADAKSVSEGNKCKPRYPSNAFISFQELDMLPALQETFLQ